MEQERLRFWQVRARDKKEVIFSNGQLLWDTANEYFNYCADNPIEPTGGVEFKQKVSPFSLQGVCLYIGCTTKYFNDIKLELVLREESLTEPEQDLLATMNRIEDVIYTFKYNYGVTGLLNVRIIMRELELSEKNRVVKRIIRVREG